MKIDAYLSGVIEKYVKQSKQQKVDKVDIKQPKEKPSEGQTKTLDKVEISSEAKLLADIKADEDRRADKIKQIRSQIENGTYKPDLEKLAKSILKEWKGE
ncbi:flagellar biosynthesis anti-sigma factor FlgM [Hippea jasoniae]|uniref:flagellar biosynthesis anti-sigma factor FlgM n=1 Tax=Hippea jasoniae TaxID=944479 RepID=UPI0005597977|nr:flagellar biosynthesis anti-sigma factor FlgM [Hippea jasoniae]